MSEIYRYDHITGAAVPVVTNDKIDSLIDKIDTLIDKVSILEEECKEKCDKPMTIKDPTLFIIPEHWKYGVKIDYV